MTLGRPKLPDKDKKQNITLTLSPKTIDEMKHLAKARGVTVSRLADTALIVWIVHHT